MRVEHAMTKPVITLPPATPVKKAAELMSAKGFTVLPVVDEAGELVGVVSEGDLLAERLPADARFPQEPGRAKPGPTVQDVMTTTDLLTAARGDDIRALIRRMHARRIRVVPICEERTVVGIVTYRDLTRLLASSDERIAANVHRRMDWCFTPGRFQTAVRDGEVVLTDRMDRPDEWHTARVLAEQVPGVTSARVVAPSPAQHPAESR